jgi:hypothetical protein
MEPIQDDRLFEVTVDQTITTYVMAKDKDAAKAFTDSVEWGHDSDFGSERSVNAYPVDRPDNDDEWIWNGSEWIEWGSSHV